MEHEINLIDWSKKKPKRIYVRLLRGRNSLISIFNNYVGTYSLHRLYLWNLNCTEVYPGAGKDKDKWNGKAENMEKKQVAIRVGRCYRKEWKTKRETGEEKDQDVALFLIAIEFFISLYLVFLLYFFRSENFDGREQRPVWSKSISYLKCLSWNEGWNEANPFTNSCLCKKCEWNYKKVFYFIVVPTWFTCFACAVLYKRCHYNINNVMFMGKSICKKVVQAIFHKSIWCRLVIKPKRNFFIRSAHYPLLVYKTVNLHYVQIVYLTAKWLHKRT